MKNLIKSPSSLALVFALAMLATPSLASDADDMAKLGKEGNLVCGDCDFSGEDLRSNTNFFKADLHGVDFTGSNLSGMNLRGANLKGADFTEANLTNTILTQADLTNADFHDADLTGASLGGADLTGAEVDRANFTDANLTKAILDEDSFDYATVCRTTIPDGRVTNRDCDD